MATIVDRESIKEPGRVGLSELMLRAPVLATALAVAGILLVYLDTAKSSSLSGTAARPSHTASLLFRFACGLRGASAPSLRTQLPRHGGPA